MVLNGTTDVNKESLFTEQLNLSNSYFATKKSKASGLTMKSLKTIAFDTEL